MRFLNFIGIRGILNILFLLMFAVLIFRTCQSEKKYKDLLNQRSSVIIPKTEVSIEAEEISRQVDTAGKEKVVYRLAEPIIKEIENHSKIDSFAKEASIDKSKIRSLTKINGELNEKNIQLKKLISEDLKDTVYEYRDKWLVNTIYKRDTTWRSDIWIDASVNKVDFTQKKYWLFGKNEYRSTVWFNSPYIKPSGLQYLEIKQNKPVFDFSLEIEGRYLFDSQDVIIGPMGRISLGRVNVQGGYMYNPRGVFGTGAWAGGSYKVY